MTMDDVGDVASTDSSKPAKMRQTTKVILDAAKIFLLMPKNIPISRSARFQWLLDNLNNVVTVSDNLDVDENSVSTLEVISAVAVGETCTPAQHQSTTQYRVTTATELVFLSRTYRVVYCLDMSPSQSAVDIGQGEILFDEIINCFRISLLGLCRQFSIGGSDIVFQPCLYLTVIVNTPFFISPAQQVLIKGVQVSIHNVRDIVAIVQGQFHHLEGRIAEVSAMAYEQMHRQQARAAAARSGTAFGNANSNDNECNSNIPMVSPDANFVNMLRYSMLAISLLPENSLSNILVITDGVAAMPDSNIMESILYQLHYDSISLSFLKVGSCFHWNSSAGYVSYTDLLLFLSHSTLGTYLDRFPVVKPEPTLSMNLYQELYLLWTYNCKDKIISPHLLQDIQKYKSDEFQPSKLPTLLSKRQTEENVNACMLLLICRRMREGYTVNEVCISNGMIDVKLSLHWKSFIYIHYFIRTQWPISTNISHLEVFISAPYDFLHDITCCLTRRETIKSAYRQAVFERFWVRMTQLTTADNQLSRQLSAMLQSAQWYSLPESVRNGIPVLVLASSNANTTASSAGSDDVASKQLLLSATDAPACRGFADIWMALCQVHTNNWRKWLHTHKLSLILRHDHPLPKHMHLANASGRFQVIQCRQAAMSLYRLLNTWSSFVLIDNHTYLKLLYADDQHQQQQHQRQYRHPHHHHVHPYDYQQQPSVAPAPLWFCIVRVSSRLPCATLHLGFVSGTPGHVRYNTVTELRRQLDRLCHVTSGEEIRCCSIIKKPLEKILIKYERMPNDFHTVIFPDGTEPPYSMQSFPASPLAGTLFTTLSRYLFHQRWIWSATHPPNPRLDVPAISRILNTLTRMRLREGFKFAHSAAGIVTMVLELDMIPSGTCVVQYVLFPPHSACWGEESGSGASSVPSPCVEQMATNGASADGTNKVLADEEDVEGEDESDGDESGDSELQMVTEVWIEPQYGYVKANESRNGYMNNKYYYELSELIRLADLRCINALLTLEHLSLMCQRKESEATDKEYIGTPTDTLGVPDIEIQIPSTRRPSRKRYTSMSHDLGLHEFDRLHSRSDNSTPWNPFLVQRIQHIAFKFDAIGILPLCRQTELLFSMFIEPAGHSVDPFPDHNESVTTNCLLLENIHHYLGQLNDAELSLTPSDCLHLVHELRERCNYNSHESSVRNRIWLQSNIDTNETHTNYNNSWRCFVKGVSVTHAILTFAPKDTSQLFGLPSECSTGPIAPSLPIYVFDCPLAMLVDSFVRPASHSSHEGSPSLDAVRTLIGVNPGDSYEDRRYNNMSGNGNGGFKLDGLRVRSARNSNSDSTTVRSEETCATLEDIGKPLGAQQQQQRGTLREHLDHRENTVAQHQYNRALVLSHDKCFAWTLFAALHCRYAVHAVDVQAAMDQCWETLFEIDISDYICNVCGHMKHTEIIDVHMLNQPTACSDLSPIHRLVKENFLRVVNDSFSPVPTNKRFYYFSRKEVNADKPGSTVLGVDDDEGRSYVTSNSTNTLASEEVPSSTSVYSAQAQISVADVSSVIASTAAAAGFVASDSSDNILDPASTNTNSTEAAAPLYTPLDGHTDTSCATLHRLLNALNTCNEDFLATVSPLFLHFVCSVRYENIHFAKAVKVIPTCFGEVAHTLNGLVSTIDKSKLRVSLDVVCLTLPSDVQNVITDYSTKGMRSTSFCSDGFVPSTRSSASDASFTSDFKEPESQFQTPDVQRRAINILKSEIKWLLHNESITSMLDICQEPIAQETLDLVMQHVENSVSVCNIPQPTRPCCSLEIVRLSFVCARVESHAHFIHEFPQITLLLPEYKLCQQGEYYYLSKNQLVESIANADHGGSVTPNQLDTEQDDAHSDISSLGGGSVLSTSTGYDDDVSGDEEGFDWLVDLSNKRSHLPNFWLIMQVASHAVRIYFHCRFVELPTSRVTAYKSVRLDIATAIRDLCKRVNQTMLLQRLYETRICSSLLEPEESFNEFGNRNLSFTRLRVTQENVQINRRSPKARQRAGRSKFKIERLEEKKSDPVLKNSVTLRKDPIFDDENNTSDEEMNYEPGYFKCPVIWEHPFSLHPRLKTGMGKSSLNVGFNAMTSVLEKFNVVDRRNMFVIRSKAGCVFYLYLYEHIQSQSLDRRQLSASMNPLDPPVSRSPSVASLPTGQQRDRSGELANVTPTCSEIRPRVRSFGERESTLFEDCIILKVRGIPPICDEISCELVGVLQKRLDDTVLEFLSVTLARNWRCPLTPEDVAFLKKPSRLPDKYITMSLSHHVVHFIDAFYYYLKENLLQWMNVPNYTDSKFGQYHFKDNATENPDTSLYHEESIFLFNQNQNPSSGQPSSGHHAIAVVSFCVIDKRSHLLTSKAPHPQPIPSLSELSTLLAQGPMFTCPVAQLVSNSETYSAEFNECASHMYVQFRIWKNGRLNWDLLSDILLKAVNQTQWDLITEYYFLRVPFCSDELPDHDTKRKNEIFEVRMKVMQKQMFLAADDNLSGDDTDDTLIPEEDRKGKDTDESIFVAVQPETTNFDGIKSKTRLSYTGSQGTTGKGKSLKSLQQFLKPPPETGLKTPVLKAIQISTSENGLSGTLSSQYWNELGDWLSLGEILLSPNVRMFTVKLKPQDNLGLIAREVSNQMSIISEDTVRGFYFTPKESDGAIVDNYTPFDYTAPPERSLLSTRYRTAKDLPVLLFVRNNQYWKLQMNALESGQYPDGINGNFLQHSQYQRTMPALVQNRTFVPRQKLAVAIITREKIVFLTYNWNKDNAERLSDLQLAQSLWLNARSVSLSSGIQAKLGLFHNLPHQRQTVHTVQNPYMQYMQEPEVVSSFQSDRIRKSQLVSAVAASAALAGNTFPSLVLQPERSNFARQRHSSVTSSNSTSTPTTAPTIVTSPHNVSTELARVFRDRYVDYDPSDSADVDTTLAMCHEMQALNAAYVSLAEIRTLHNLYISGEKIRNLEYINLIRKFGRIIHYCHTPMLFLSKWRIATAATRDQTLLPREISDLSFDAFDEWHNELCVAFVTECKIYIKKLGFEECPIKPDRLLLSEWQETGTIKVFLQKNIKGGLMIYIIAMVEPFVTTTLMVVECDRFVDAPVKKDQFSLTFLDECDRIRDTMHLHSFTYDFHLRAVSNYLSGVAGIKLYSGFHLTRFLDDFIRYYTKSPNYARNLVYAGEMEVPNLVTDGKHLYNYLLSHNRDYGFEAVTMGERHDLDVDYVLVQTVRVPHIVYTDSADRQHTDNFDLTLIASYVHPPQAQTEEHSEEAHVYQQREARLSSPGHCCHSGYDCSDNRRIKLRYYIVLTTRGDIYPKATAERKMGKFRTVSINAKRNTNGEIGMDVDTQASTSADNTISSTLMPSDEDTTVINNCTPMDDANDSDGFSTSPFLHEAGTVIYPRPRLHPLNLFRVSIDSSPSKSEQLYSDNVPQIVGHINKHSVRKSRACDPTLTMLLHEPKIDIASTSFFMTEPALKHKSPSASIEAELNELDRTVQEDAEVFKAIWKEKHFSSNSNTSDDPVTQFEFDTTVKTIDDKPLLMQMLENKFPLLNLDTSFGEDTIEMIPIEKQILSIDEVKVPVASLSVPTVSGFHIKKRTEVAEEMDNSLKVARSPAVSTSGMIATASVASQKPEIRQEKVNYLGYFSTHEQLMQNVMHECASNSEQKLRDIIQKGTVDCRTHYLWDKLMTVCCSLSFAEFAELKARSRLAHISVAADACAQSSSQSEHVTAVLAQPADWHERFAGSIAAKYPTRQRRHYVSDDGSVRHWVALHHRYDRACILMTVDFHANHGNVYAMDRVLSNTESEMDKQDKQDFIQDFIQKLSYQIWLEMVHN